MSEKGEPDVPPYLLCPLTYTVMKDPVVAEDGRTYERQAIEEWIRKKGTSPIDPSQKLTLGRLVTNFTLRDILDSHGYTCENVSKAQPMPDTVKRKRNVLVIEDGGEISSDDEGSSDKDDSEPFVFADDMDNEDEPELAIQLMAHKISPNKVAMFIRIRPSGIRNVSAFDTYTILVDNTTNMGNYWDFVEDDLLLLLSAISKTYTNIHIITYSGDIFSSLGGRLCERKEIKSFLNSIKIVKPSYDWNGYACVQWNKTTVGDIRIAIIASRTPLPRETRLGAQHYVIDYAVHGPREYRPPIKHAAYYYHAEKKFAHYALLLLAGHLRDTYAVDFHYGIEWPKKKTQRTLAKVYEKPTFSRAGIWKYKELEYRGTEEMNATVFYWHKHSILQPISVQSTISAILHDPGEPLHYTLKMRRAYIKALKRILDTPNIALRTARQFILDMRGEVMGWMPQADRTHEKECVKRCFQYDPNLLKAVKKKARFDTKGHIYLETLLHAHKHRNYLGEAYPSTWMYRYQTDTYDEVEAHWAFADSGSESEWDVDSDSS